MCLRGTCFLRLWPHPVWQWQLHVQAGCLPAPLLPCGSGVPGRCLLRNSSHWLPARPATLCREGLRCRHAMGVHALPRQHLPPETLLLRQSHTVARRGRLHGRQENVSGCLRLVEEVEDGVAGAANPRWQACQGQTICSCLRRCRKMAAAGFWAAPYAAGTIVV